MASTKLKPSVGEMLIVLALVGAFWVTVRLMLLILGLNHG